MAEWRKQFSSGNCSLARSSEVKLRMGDLGDLTSHHTSPSFGRDVKLWVPCLDAACTVGLNKLSVARNPDKPTEIEVEKQRQNISERTKTDVFLSFLYKSGILGTGSLDASKTDHIAKRQQLEQGLKFSLQFAKGFIVRRHY